MRALKNKLSLLIPPAFKVAATRHLKIGSNPYGGAAPTSLPGGTSDFFLARAGEYRSHFVAENPFAIMQGRPIACRHLLYFYDASGKAIGSHTVRSDRYNIVIPLTERLADVEFAGFFHQAYYDGHGGEEAKLIHQHRGYTGYKFADDPESVFATLHGNFGGLFCSDAGSVDTFAVQRSDHSYSTQFRYRSGFNYELFFLNPTRSPLAIAIQEVDEDKQQRVIEECLLRPFGAQLFAYQGNGRQLFWSSALPVCRPIIFEHPVGERRFDVFHG